MCELAEPLIIYMWTAERKLRPLVVKQKKVTKISMCLTKLLVHRKNKGGKKC